MIQAFLMIACMIAGGNANDTFMTQLQDVNIIEAVQKNRVADVEKALVAGADVNTTDKNKRNLLLIATQAGHLDMVTLLVAKKADVNQQDDRLDSPFLYAGASGRTDFLKIFLQNGARFDIFNRYNGTALIPACERGHVETVLLLANTKGFPIDHVNRLGWTALMEAVVLGDGTKKYVEIVRILVAAGCDTSIPDKDNVTALAHAKRSGYKEIATILEKAKR